MGIFMKKIEKTQIIFYFNDYLKNFIQFFFTIDLLRGVSEVGKKGIFDPLMIPPRNKSNIPGY